MAQFNIALTEERWHGLLSQIEKTKPFPTCLKKFSIRFCLPNPRKGLAMPYERAENRTAYRNGFRDRQQTTLREKLDLTLKRFQNGLLEKYYSFLAVDAMSEGSRVRSKGLLVAPCCEL